MIMLYKQKSAFSMLELIMVIIILGIVSSIGAEIIANIYGNYITQRAQHRSSIKTQLALNQIVNRLRYAMPATIIRRVGKTGTPEDIDAPMSSGQDNYTVLQWVGVDNDSFEAITSNTLTGVARRPGWSGFCDIASSSATALSTPGSNFTLTNAIQANLGRSGTNFSLFFPEDTTAYSATGAGSSITLSSNLSNNIVERYKLAWTSYALVVENGDLKLYYGFASSKGSAIGNTSALLLKNIETFKFQGAGGNTRIKICVREDIGNGITGTNGIPSCKEKVVF